MANAARMREQFVRIVCSLYLVLLRQATIESGFTMFMFSGSSQQVVHPGARGRLLCSHFTSIDWSVFAVIFTLIRRRGPQGENFLDLGYNCIPVEKLRVGFGYCGTGDYILELFKQSVVRVHFSIV